MDVDTGLLRAFVVTAEEHHFGRAAHRLFITQQGLSKRVRKLEDGLDVRLFERSNRRVELTDAGRRLLPAAREAIAAVDSVFAAVTPTPDPLRVDVLFEYLAPVQWVREAVHRESELRVEVSARRNHRPVVGALRRGDFDVAFGRAPAIPWPRDLRRRPAVLEPIGLLVGTGHDLAGRSQVTMAELAEVPLFFPMAGAPDDWTDLMNALTDQFRLTVEQPSTSIGFEHFLDCTAQDPARATLLGRAMVAPTDPRLRIIPLIDPVPVFAWSIMWRRRVPDTAIDGLLAGARTAQNAIAPELLRDPRSVWLPDADREWWRRSLDRRTDASG